MKKIYLNLMLLIGIFAIYSLTNNAFASIDVAGSDGGDMQVVLCNILNFVTGGIGKTIASFIIIGIGIGFFTGKATWGTMIGVTLGIAAMFGAPAVITAVTGDGAELCPESGA